MIREKQVLIKRNGEDENASISYFSPYLMKKRREAELSGSQDNILLEISSFDISSLLMVGEEVVAEGRGYDHYDSFRDLQDQATGKDVCVQSCGNCAYFLFSGMARDMSNGSRGYCLHGRLGQNLSTNDIREIFDYCHHFRNGHELERDEYRQRWKTSLQVRNQSRAANGKDQSGRRPSAGGDTASP